jgi:hypothetical protein
VRRSMVTMSMLAVALSTPLAAQATRAWAFGFGATLGGGWQIEGVDVGYVRGARAGPLRFASLTARLASFVDEGQIVGGTRGFVFGIAVGGRTGLWQLAEVGSERDPSAFGADLTLEAGAYVGARSPLPQGSPWAGLSVLPGLRFGDADGLQYRLMIGPTVLVGRETDVRALLALRFEVPLARRERHP